jgi:hypothetical protein
MPPRALPPASRIAAPGAALVLVAIAACAPTANVVEVETLQTVPGLEVTVATHGSQRLDLTVANWTGEDWTLAWDESAYVQPGGRALRLLKERRTGERRTLPQAPSPLPDGAKIHEQCYLAEGTLVGDGRPTRATGELHLVLVRGERRHTWRGLLHLAVDVRSRPHSRTATD